MSVDIEKMLSDPYAFSFYEQVGDPINLGVEKVIDQVDSQLEARDVSDDLAETQLRRSASIFFGMFAVRMFIIGVFAGTVFTSLITIAWSLLRHYV